MRTLLDSQGKGQRAKVKGQRSKGKGQRAKAEVKGAKDKGYRSFFVTPEGSKEGWDLSVDGDRRRKEFIAWLTQQLNDDPWGPLNWVEIQYGDDHDEPARIVSDSGAIARKAEEST